MLDLHGTVSEWGGLYRERTYYVNHAFTVLISKVLIHVVFFTIPRTRQGSYT